MDVKLSEKHSLVTYSIHTLIILSICMFMLFSITDVSMSLYGKRNFVLNESKDGTIANIYKYKRDKKALKYPVKIDQTLVKLINWTDPEYPLDVSYLIENKDLCASVKNLTVLVVVNTATDHFGRRQTIRKTWTNNTYFSHLGTLRTLFLLGRTVDTSIQADIEKESKEYGDILQGDFMDTYLNLTHKGVMGLKWLNERCRNAKMILKVDDDFIVNIFIYFRKIGKSLPSTHVYCLYGTDGVIRDKENKWYLSENHFKGEKIYREHCKGKFVSMRNDIIPSLYISARKTPFFPYDDVTLFGYAMHNIKGLRYKTLEQKDMENVNSLAITCLKEQKNKCPNLVIGAPKRKEMEDAWLMMLKFFSPKSHSLYMKV
ncbi:beta-1,3-galactosyltransferase 1-like [Mercenaria mercenaria]|uniref:beta-1,3-galactosyltransferase 1-like n=1 Tax=Mercenaria mercenaria TaxID=6596 RepID=UPI00234ECEBF|nr:beta-1,3-galactosyltransferase 1-like [Mercenaria mercenaria]